MHSRNEQMAALNNRLRPRFGVFRLRGFSLLMLGISPALKTAIVSSIVLLANRLDIITTAAGVETFDQLRLIREAGCTEAQGYLFSVPRPLEEVMDHFAESSVTQGSI